MPNTDIDLLRHQQQFIQIPWEHQELEAVFLIGGYSCGKSFSLVSFILNVSAKYFGEPVVCGIGSPTITFFKKTILIDLERTLISCNIRYRLNQQDNSIIIGTVKWYVIPIEQPKDIYGYNFSIFIVDELDEISQEKAIEAFGAIQERTRIKLPDGRKPFSAFASTAQGLKGIYQITENLKEKQIPFAIIRGLTKDNTNLPPEYYDRLYALYNENERLAFLEGQFVNLTAGRVYPGYDETTCSADDIEVMPNDVIHVGQDLNIGASCATCIVKRDKLLYVVKTFQFKDFSQSAKEIRTAFPTNQILYYPDASGKMIIQGYLAEFQQYGIDLRTGTVNPPIIERIFLVNKMLSTGRMKRCKSVKDLDLAWKTRVYDDNGNPAKSKVHPAPDDTCDSLEYSLWRILSADPDYFDLWQFTQSYKKSA